MDILLPLSEPMQKIIKNEDLTESLGVKAIVDLEELAEYFVETNRSEIYESVVGKEEGIFCVIESQEMNDHLIVGLRSTLLDPKNDTLFFLVPAVKTYLHEAKDFFQEVNGSVNEVLREKFALETKKCLATIELIADRDAMYQ
jgi:hypothetical protein